MKKLISAAVLLLGMCVAFSSCGREEPEDGLKSTLVGDWYYTSGENINRFEYYSFSKEGKLAFFNSEAVLPTFSNGSLSLPMPHSWKKWFWGEFWLDGDVLYVTGYPAGTVEVLHNDRIRFHRSPDAVIMPDGIMERVTNHCSIP